MNDNINLSSDFQIPVQQYAVQGNAILGIKGSGKSYAATLIAEQLMDAKIPIIAFDPSGIWKFLKIGKETTGYPVVVAGTGQDADLPLSVNSAPDIVQAAIDHHVSVIFDLFSISLSKNDWKKIVEQCFRLLLYENKGHGIRHVFLEEAAEFCPQRIMSINATVYAEVEKFARMGGNSSLGYTLINQRSQEVNKAVLELCDTLLLFRQKGSHAISSLDKWLKNASAIEPQKVINSIPKLKPGQCWVWLEGTDNPNLVEIQEKKTFHPDRKAMQKPFKKSDMIVDVSAFVARMKTVISKSQIIKEQQRNHFPVDVKDHKKPKKSIENNQKLINEITSLKKENDSLCDQLELSKDENTKLKTIIKSLQDSFKPQYDSLSQLYGKIQIEISHANNVNWEVWLNKLQGGARRMLEILIEQKRLSRQQLALLTGMSHKSGTFATYLSKLSSLGLIKKEGNEYILQDI